MSNADIALLERWLNQGDPDAFRSVALRYAGMVYGTCKRILRNAADAEDVAQECFEALAAGRARPTTALGPWLHRVATNKSLRRLYSEGRRKQHEKTFSDSNLQTRPNPQWDDIYDMVDEAIERLPEQLRALIVSHFLDNETHDAIAQRLGVSRQTITYRIGKGVDQIRGTLKRKGVEIAALSFTALLAANTSEAAPAGMMARIGKLALAGPKVAAPLGWTLAVKAAVGVASALVIIGAGFGAWHLRSDSRPAPPYLARAADAATPVSVASAPTTNLGSKAAEEATNVGKTSDGGGKDQVEQETTSGPGSIRGFVWDENCQPVAGVRVTIALSATGPDIAARRVHDPFQETMTDEAGSYELRELPVDARLVLFATTEELLAMDACRLKWTPHLENFRLRLEPKNHITGVVVDGAGNPVSDALVIPFKDFADWDVHVQSDSEGRFDLAYVEQGKWRAQVWAEGYAPATSDWIASNATEKRITLTLGGSVSGVVMDATTGAPAPNLSAHVVGKNRPDSVTKTDGSGQFRVSSLEPGEYWARVEDPDYVVPSKESRNPTPIMIKAGEETRDVRVTVARAATVAGRIYNKDSGAGVRGVRVYALRIEGGDLQVGQGFSEETGPSGEYRIGGLPAGRYSLTASGGTGFRQNSWDVARAEARTMEIELGKPYAGVDFAFWKGIVVRGKVVGTDGEPVGNVCVRARTVGQRSSDSYSTDGFANEDGTFELVGFEAPSSKLYIQAGGANHLEWNAAPHDELICEAQGPLELPQEGVSGLTLTVRPGAGMTGRVLDAQGVPMNKVFVSADLPQVGRREVSSRPFSGNGCITDALGRYRLAGLLPAAYEIHLSKNSGRDHEAYTVDFITLGEGERIERRNLVWGINKAQDTGLTISGRVTDAQGQALRGAQVMAFSDAGNTNPYVTTDASGNYRIGGLDQGTYQVSASRNARLGESQAGVTAGSRDVNFMLRPAPTIAGHVLDAATGKPVAGAEIAQSRGANATVNGQELFVETQSDAQGRFSVSAQDSDTVTVMATAEGYATGAAVVTGVRTGAFDKDVMVRLHVEKRVTGSVRDSSGKPIADAKLFIGRAPYEFERAKPLAVSDREGGFVLTKLNPGRQTIIAQHTNFAPNSVLVDASADGPVEIVLSKGATLKGRVSFDGPRVPTTIRVFHLDRPDLSPQQEFVKNDGTYSIAPLAAGRVEVSTSSTNRNRIDMGKTRRLVLEDGKESIADFVFAKGLCVLEGKVLVGGQPAKGSVQGQMDTPGGRLGFGAPLGPDGDYRVENLEAGTVAISVRAATSDTTGLLKAASVVLTEGNSARLDFAFEGRAVLSGAIHGVTLDEAVEIGVALGDVSADVTGGDLMAPTPCVIVASTRTDAQGSFRIENLDPGLYTVIARAMPRSAANSLDRVRQAAAVVTAPDSGEQNVTINLPRLPD